MKVEQYLKDSKGLKDVYIPGKARSFDHQRKYPDIYIQISANVSIASLS